MTNPLHDTSYSEYPTLLDLIDTPTQERILGEKYLKQPLVIGEPGCARDLQEKVQGKYWYDLDKGNFVYAHYFYGHSKGTVWGSLSSGYYHVRTSVGHFMIHTIVYVWITGKMPPNGFDIDHVDGNKLNNTLSNLRCVPHAVNLRNSARHRYKGNDRGIRKHHTCNRFVAELGIKGKTVYIGLYRTKEEAIVARDEYINTRPELGYLV